MQFGEVPLGEALGAVLAHSVNHSSGVFKKGRTLSATDIEILKSAGIAKVFAAILGKEDVPEDKAAQQLAQKICGKNIAAQEPFTGRANLHASHRGVVVVDRDRVNALNRIHESITLATVGSYSVVDVRQMVATVKIIPFAVQQEILDAALSTIGDTPLIRVEKFQPHHIGLVISKLPNTKPPLIQKSETAMRERVTALGSEISNIIVCDHTVESVRHATKQLRTEGCSPILIFGASAIVDRSDIVPASVTASGGEVVHLGMPVDPGNLMMFGRLEDTAVIGVPSCARSPKVNGFDWVLERTLAGIKLGAQDIMDMGAGGLLAEISSRPSPREGKPIVQRAPKIAGIVLAAGKSSRMGSNKLLAELGGKPLVVHSVEKLKSSSVQDIVVVTGNGTEQVKEVLRPLSVTVIYNEHFAEGLSTSLKCGLNAIPADVDAALICLGDMPLVDAQTVDRLIAAFSVSDHRTICVPTFNGVRGNPVLWGRQHFGGLLDISGDQGGRLLMEALSDEVVEVACETNAVLVDVDTPQALSDLKSALNP
jgi:molybdenum cofactor cytidylyltransferase